MINAIQHWTQRHPYTLTGLLFLAMVLLGWTALGWGERQLGFLLLIYFIVALGIRLDEISRTLGGSSGNLPAAAGDPETLMAQLQEIRSLLRQIQASLERLPVNREERKE
jgi:Zn-dependent protease with chaperone function